MLTCFQGPTNLVFQKILKFFIKPKSIVLDITYGRGFSWRNIYEQYSLIKLDRRKLSDEIIQIDFNKYLRKRESKSIDCVYFDPPYYFKEKIRQFNIENQMLNKSEEVFWTEKEFETALKTIKKDIPRILRNNGIFIVKIMDGATGKEFYPNAFKIFNVMSKVMIPRGIFICPINREDAEAHFIRENHIYYLVFENV